MILLPGDLLQRPRSPEFVEHQIPEATAHWPWPYGDRRSSDSIRERNARPGVPLGSAHQRDIARDPLAVDRFRTRMPARNHCRSRPHPAVATSHLHRPRRAYESLHASADDFSGLLPPVSGRCDAPVFRTSSVCTVVASSCWSAREKNGIDGGLRRRGAEDGKTPAEAIHEACLVRFRRHDDDDGRARGHAGRFARARPGAESRRPLVWRSWAPDRLALADAHITPVYTCISRTRGCGSRAREPYRDAADRPRTRTSAHR